MLFYPDLPRGPNAIPPHEFVPSLPIGARFTTISSPVDFATPAQPIYQGWWRSRWEIVGGWHHGGGIDQLAQSARYVRHIAGPEPVDPAELPSRWRWLARRERERKAARDQQSVLAITTMFSDESDESHD